MISICFLNRKKWLLSLLFIILATGIHSTAIIMLIAFLIKILKKSKTNFAVVCIMSAIFALSINKLSFIFFKLFPHYEMYDTTNLVNSRGGSFFLGLFIFIVLVLGVYTTNVLSDDMASFLVFLTSIGSIFYMVGMQSQIIIRVADYFLIYATVVIPIVNYKLSKRFLQSRLVYVLLSSIVMISGIVLLIYKLSKNYGEIIPYSLH